MKLSLSVLRIFSRDWQRSADFYEHLLAMPCQFRDDDMGWAQFDAGAAEPGRGAGDAR